METALDQLSVFGSANIHVSNWLVCFLGAARVSAAKYESTIVGTNKAARDLFAVLPTNPLGSINPFLDRSKARRWKVLFDAGRMTIWNNGTRSHPQSVLFKEAHIRNGLRDDAIDVLLAHLADVNTAPPARAALAVFLTRDKSWEQEPDEDALILAASAFIGLDANEFQRITTSRPLGVPLLGEPEWSPTLLVASQYGPVASQPQAQEALSVQTEEDVTTSHRWTRTTSMRPLRDANVKAITARALDLLDAENIVFPEIEATVERCVTALLLGHLVLQGPPGTGKTTLARVLCQAFEVEYVESTATSEWSPFHVIGGFRPNSSGGLVPVHGNVVRAVVDCAARVRLQTPDDAGADISPDEPQGTWLFIDEFNRADIDKAIGSLYTLLSSLDPQHLDRTPLDLWYESSPELRQVWVPARFRIIAAMNDLDTGFVNAMSQGLTRRFQFVTISVPERAARNELSAEISATLASSHRWLAETYPDLAYGTLPELMELLATELQMIQNVVSDLRHPESVPGWPIGSAQIVDLMKYVLLGLTSSTEHLLAIDAAFADRLIPQMSQIDDSQESVFKLILESNNLVLSAKALRHLLDPHSV